MSNGRELTNLWWCFAESKKLPDKFAVPKSSNERQSGAVRAADLLGGNVLILEGYWETNRSQPVGKKRELVV